MPELADPVAISFFGISIRWYAIFLLTGILVALAVCRRVATKRGLDRDFPLDVAPWMVLGGIIGARLYYIALKWRYFVDHPSNAPNVREGGLAVHGALIGGVLAFALYCWRRNEPVLLWLDLIAASVPFGQAIGRWGNWANREAFGRPSDLPWAIEVDPVRRPAGYEKYSSFHPTFLYESLLDLAFGLILVWLVLRIPNSDKLKIGDAAAIYLIGYGIIRFLVESLRTDSVYIHGVRVAWLASLLLIVLGGCLLLWNRTRATEPAA